jgi:3-hydroxyisobutyrate dehydrogenase
MTTVAIVGTGRMGSAMAGSIRRAGFDVIVQNRTPDRAAALALQLECAVAGSPAEASAAADVIITMLADDVAVRSTLEGPDGLLAGARRGTIIADMSTVRPDTITAFGDRAAAAGIGLLDAPVSGSVQLAATGALTLMVGGDEADLERARPVLEALSKTIVYLGPLGSGAAMKLAVNTVIFGLNGAVAEALVLAEAAGIDRELAYDVIAAGAAGAPFVGYKRDAFLAPETTPVAFSLDLTEKDLGLITDFAQALGVVMPQAAVNHVVVADAIAHGLGSEDLAGIAGELRARRQPGAPRTDSHRRAQREGAPT